VTHLDTVRRNNLSAPGLAQEFFATGSRFSQAGVENGSVQPKTAMPSRTSCSSWIAFAPRF
jgi:hypothetical protein